MKSYIIQTSYVFQLNIPLMNEKAWKNRRCVRNIPFTNDEPLSTIVSLTQ